MYLWIRSQDKETLIKCEKILVEEGKDRFAIVNYIDTKNWFRLGLYKTKKRALEVLDEINEVKYYKYMASLGWASFANSVLKPKPMEEQKLLFAMMNTYQMPEE